VLSALDVVDEERPSVDLMEDRDFKTSAGNAESAFDETLLPVGGECYSVGGFGHKTTMHIFSKKAKLKNAFQENNFSV
jgi:hypothetical protein